MTKNTPKNPAVAVSAINLPASSLGKGESKLSRYIAGIALTNKTPIPPAAAHEVEKESVGYFLMIITQSLDEKTHL